MTVGLQAILIILFLTNYKFAPASWIYSMHTQRSFFTLRLK